MSEDSILIVKVEQYLLCSNQKRLKKNTVCIVYYSCTYVLGRRKKDKK